MPGLTLIIQSAFDNERKVQDMRWQNAIRYMTFKMRYCIRACCEFVFSGIFPACCYWKSAFTTAITQVQFSSICLILSKYASMYHSDY